MSEQSGARVPLSVLVPVKNEAANLRDCLASVAFAQEIVVVDSASTDDTQAAAEAAGARIVQFVWNGKFPRKKNWALESIRWQHEWVLIVDADERVTPELEREISQAIRRTDVDGFYLNRRFWFLGGWINHCGYFPSWNLRLFRHRLGRYSRAGPNIYRLQWSITLFQILRPSSRSTIAILLGKRRRLQRCISEQVERHCEPRHLEHR